MSSQKEFIDKMVNYFGARNEDGSKNMTMKDLQKWIEKQNIPFKLIQGMENGREYWTVKRK